MADDKPHVKEPRPEYTAQSATSPAVVESTNPVPKTTTEAPLYLCTDPNTPQAWLPLPDESCVWYERFTVYRLLGPGRTVANAWREYATSKGDKMPEQTATQKNIPGGWYATAKRNRWRERALAWDMHVWADHYQEDEAELIREGKRLRLYASSRLAMKALEVVEQVKVEKEQLGAASAALKTALREMRQDLEGSDRYVRHDVAVLMGEIPGEHLARLKKRTDKT